MGLSLPLLMVDYVSIGVGVSVIILGLVVMAFLSRKSSSPKATASTSTPSKNTTKAETSVFLNKQRQSVPLSEIIELSHDTRLYRFSLPTQNTILGLPVGKHIKLYCPNRVGVVPGEWNGRADPEYEKKEIQRSYTPTSSDDDLGHFDLVVKVYKGGVIERFPDGGKASQYLDSMQVGDSIELAGPFGLIEYTGAGQLEHKRKPIAVKQVGMIAGGTGITPMLQVIRAAMKDPQDKTVFSLLYANQTEHDILVRDMLESTQQENPDRFKLWYTLDRPNADWKYSQGFVTEKMIEERLPAASNDTVILLCGPPPMIQYACLPNLEKLGHQKDKLIAF